MARKSGSRLFLICVGAALALAACGGADTNAVSSGNEAVLMTPARLKSEASFLGQPIYWAGPRKGYEYEFQRTATGYVYVRYLAQGLPAGAAGKFLTVATYPFIGAFKGVKAAGKGKAFAGPGGSIIYVRPDPTSVLVAFPGIDYEIEIYDPSPLVARLTAESGRVRAVS